MKLFFKIALYLLIFEILLGVTNAYFFMENTSFLGVELSTVTSILMSVFSLPISVFGRDLPFYHIETWIAVSLTILNILIQSFLVFRIYKAFKK